MTRRHLLLKIVHHYHPKVRPVPVEAKVEVNTCVPNRPGCRRPMEVYRCGVQETQFFLPGILPGTFRREQPHHPV